MPRVAIIPARGGSKRIPRKNIRLFLGRPIIAYSIQAALDSSLFDEVMVSTDDEEVAKVARYCGASVPFIRSAENADDFATTIDVIAEVIRSYEKAGRRFEQAACIYPCAPFVTSEQLKIFHTALDERRLDCIFPVLQYSYPIQRSLALGEHGLIRMNYPEHLTTRSQDLPKAYHDCGQFYLFNVMPLINQHKLWTENTGAIVISDMLAQDIDEEHDWELAEFKYSFLKDRGLV